MTLEQREQQRGDVEPSAGGWLGALDAKYAIGFAAVFILLGLITAGAILDLPGLAGGPPSVEDVPGEDERAAGLSLADVERAYVAGLEERRLDGRRGCLEWSGVLADRATYTNRRNAKAAYGDVAPPSEDELDRLFPDTDVRPRMSTTWTSC